jgi:transcriptional regulator with XRE-family HTH domain
MIGKQIAQLRKEASVSQEKLARKADIPTTVLTAWETKAIDMRVSRLIRVVAALGYFLDQPNNIILTKLLKEELEATP